MSNLYFVLKITVRLLLETVNLVLYIEMLV